MEVSKHFKGRKRSEEFRDRLNQLKDEQAASMKDQKMLRKIQKKNAHM